MRKANTTSAKLSVNGVFGPSPKTHALLALLSKLPNFPPKAVIDRPSEAKPPIGNAAAPALPVRVRLSRGGRRGGPNPSRRASRLVGPGREAPKYPLDKTGV